MVSKKKGYFPAPILPLVGVETHAHLDSKVFNDDFSEVVERAISVGIKYIGQVFLSPDAYRMNISKFSQYPIFFYILGIHPTEAYLYSPDVEKDIISLVAQNQKIKAIGEIGLDYYWKDVEPELQKKVFTSQLVLAKNKEYPVVIHSRDAFYDTISILKENGFVNKPVLWHCFSGSLSMVEEIINSGWFISLPGTVTFPANSSLREAVKSIPLERLMIETDCPFLSPVPCRGKRNEPAYLPYTAKIIAEVRGIDITELWEIAGKNALHFFQLDLF